MLILKSCRLGDLIDDKFSKLSLLNLRFLHIHSDHIGNQGIKRLMKLRLPRLI